jgi:putative ABC transport system permease protein
MGVEGGSNEDDKIVIPIRTALRRVFNVDYLSMIWVQVRDGRDMDRAQAQITDLLRRRHRLDRGDRQDDFRIQNQRLVLAAEMETAASFRRLITALASVALIVGGVGILSIMMLSIRERRGEIGLRVAVGAKRRDVRTQFLVEAVLLGIGGGVIGLFLGFLATASIEWGTEWRTVVSPPALALALGAAFTVSVLFGVYPAQRAASLDPIEALHAE